MPEISERGIQMPASPIRKLAPLSDAAKARGIKVYHLNIGQPDLPTPESALNAIRNIQDKILEYSPSDGYRYYRENLINYYAKYNIDLSPDEIIVTTGGSEAVLFAFLTCLNPGDEIIIPEPAYANYMAFAVSTGAIIKTIPSFMETGFALPPIKEF
ncbi:MAG TPA: aminotransferase class I/II-fold pyridoxal phosphate-dependent enzyme, partial [Dysgonamonadaceae bacterium]|nr:aminotransferase class I/II-fold pyridoxal phosphate-dependent enzyme [Dysgonamonadaceae bacterium]